MFGLAARGALLANRGYTYYRTGKRTYAEAGLMAQEGYDLYNAYKRHK